MGMEVQISISETEYQAMEEGDFPVGDEHRLQEVIAEGSLDFDQWTSLISEIENSFPDDIKKICLVYDSFLAEFPLCYGYWRKYADHKTHLCTVDKVVEVFERAVQSATYSVGVWFDYCSFSISAFEDPHDVRRLFKRGLSFVGKDFLCHTLWDKYLEFEFSQQQWSSLAHIYIQTLRFPSKKLHRYYDSFKKLVAVWKEELECQSDSAMEIQSEVILESEGPAYYKDDEISGIIKDLLDPSDGLARFKALKKYIFIGEHIYKEAFQLEEKIHCFERHIRRPYFHVKALDENQLENWHDYLNFAEKQGDFDWVVKLYERCLIPCANYPEFWIRYVDFMESKGGREIANFALARATQIFLKRVPVIHLFNAKYKEQIGDVHAARGAFPQFDTESDSSFIENVTIKANMEKRLGNFVAACNIYKEALETAAEKKKLDILPILYVHFSRLKFMTTDSADAARDILIDGIKHVPYSKLLLEELIKFEMMHGGPRNINIIDSIIANALCSSSSVLQGFSVEDLENISSLYLQFVDLCGTIHDVRKAWNRHIKLSLRSMRTAYEHPSRVAKPLKTVMEGKQNSVDLPPCRSASDHLIQSYSQVKKLSPSENYDTQSNHAAIALLSDQKSPLVDNHDIGSDSSTIGLLQSGEADNVQEKMQKVSPEASEQHREDACDPNVTSHDYSSTIDLLQSGEADHTVKVGMRQVSPEASEQGEDVCEPNVASHDNSATIDLLQSGEAGNVKEEMQKLTPVASEQQGEDACVSNATSHNYRATIDLLHSGEADNVQEKMQKVSPEASEQHKEDAWEPNVTSRDYSATMDFLQSGEADNTEMEAMQQVSPEASEQHREDACEPNVTSRDVHQVTNEIENVQGSQDFSQEDDGQRVGEHASKQDLKPLSLEGLSLDPQDNDSPVSVCATPHKGEAPQQTNLSHESTLESEGLQETSKSNENLLEGGQNTKGIHFMSSPMGTQASDSALIQTGMFSPSSSGTHQNIIQEALSRPHTHANSGRNWHQKHNSNKVHRDSRYGNQGHSHKRQHRQRQFSPEYPRTGIGAQMPLGQGPSGYSSQPLPSHNPQVQQGSQAQSQYMPSHNPQVQQGSQAQSQYLTSANLTTHQVWPMQNVQQQNSASACQSQLPAQAVAYPQTQMSQYPTHSNEQHGHLQNNQTYNQMWQYYYYQQQQQQQLLLQQLPHEQQLLLQQQQLLPNIQQQPQLQQQFPLQQEQQHLFYLQQPSQQQQQEQEERQPDQQITTTQIETWSPSNNCSKQDQGVAPLDSTGAFEAVTSAASPHSQQQSSQSQ